MMLHVSMLAPMWGKLHISISKHQKAVIVFLFERKGKIILCPPCTFSRTNCDLNGRDYGAAIIRLLRGASSTVTPLFATPLAVHPFARSRASE